jgi:hypothetical protein
LEITSSGEAKLSTRSEFARLRVFRAEVQPRDPFRKRSLIDLRTADFEHSRDITEMV